MKENKIKLIVGVMLVTIILAACGGTDTIADLQDVEPAAGGDIVETPPPVVTEAPPPAPEVTDPPPPPPPPTEAPKAPPPDELPPIPDVPIESGSAWFKPTAPGDIQVASGQVQVIKFSAVW